MMLIGDARDVFLSHSRTHDGFLYYYMYMCSCVIVCSLMAAYARFSSQLSNASRACQLGV